jgi:hypothetical protein
MRRHSGTRVHENRLDKLRYANQVYLENSQVHGSVLAHRGLDTLYARHNRPYLELRTKT